MDLLKTGLTALALNVFTLAYGDLCQTPTDARQCSRTDSPYRVTARHIEAKGIGYKEGYTTLEGFFALANRWDDWTPFLDLRGHVFNNGRFALNAGIGARYLGDTRILGLNGYYDYRSTKRQDYNQVALGLESLGELWDFRINGYLPFGKKESPKYDLQFYQFQGNSALVRQRYEYALGGFNAEGGAHVGYWNNFSLYFAGGPYYLTGKGNTTWGGKARASLRIFDYVKVDGNVSYDHLFKWIGQGELGVSLYFGEKKRRCKEQKRCCPPSLTLRERNYQPVDRFEIIPVAKKHTISSAIDPSTGLPYHFVFVDNTSASLGTYESPYHALVTAETNSNPYDIIYVFPGDGTTKNMDHGLVLKPNQKLWGSLLSYTLPTTQGSVVIPNMSTSSPQITNIDLLGSGATLSTNNEISGITFTQTSGEGISGVDPLTVSLTSSTFSGCGLGDLGIFAVRIEASSPFTATITDNTFVDNTNAGVLIKLLPGASLTEITMSENQAYNNQATSGMAAILNIEARGPVGTCTLLAKDNIYENNDCGTINIIDLDSPHDGSFTNFTGNFIGNKLTGNRQGIAFATNADNAILFIQNNDLSNNTEGSLVVSNGASGSTLVKNGSIVIDSNKINQGGSGGDAITINPAGETLSVTLTNNSIQNNQGTAFVSFFNEPGPRASLFISNNTIANNLNIANFNASGGIAFDGFLSLEAVIEKNSFSNNQQGNTIGIYGSSFTYTPETSSVNFMNNELTGNDTFTFDFYGNTPETGCLTISGNTSTATGTYTFQQQGSGLCFIVPCDYEGENTGGFNLLGVTPSTDCSGTACP